MGKLAFKLLGTLLILCVTIDLMTTLSWRRLEEDCEVLAAGRGWWGASRTVLPSCLPIKKKDAVYEDFIVAGNKELGRISEDEDIWNVDGEPLLSGSSGKELKDAFEMFQEWMAKHGKVWKSVEEMQQRLEAFVDNLRYIEMRNQQLKGTYRLGLTSLAHLTHQEFRQAYLQTGGYVDHVGRRRRPHSAKSSAVQQHNTHAFSYENATDIPPSIDWRDKGALTPVKNQGQCGSCWAFSSVGAVEAAHQIAVGEIVSLSEQELVDCDHARNRGCDGGLMDYAFDYIIANGGLDTEKHYPYKAKAQRCNILAKRNSRIVSIDDYEDVPSSDGHAFLKAVAHQPVSAAIDVESRDFQLYQDGVFTGSCGKRLNHAVLVVGYGTNEEDGKDYWIVRNSWGKGWGDNGYIKMERKGLDEPDGMCGINMEPSYPVINMKNKKGFPSQRTSNLLIASY